MAPKSGEMDKESAAFQVAVGAALRNSRLRWDLTQPDLAKICGVKRQTIYHWEQGKTTPDLPTLHRLKRWCKENDQPFDLGELLGERRVDWEETPFRFSINFLQASEQMGLRGVYPNRSRGLEAFLPFIEDAQSISVTASSFLGVRVVAPEPVPTTLRRKASEVDFRVLMTHPMFSDLREKQEGRREGAIETEINETVDTLLDWGVPKDNIRYFRGAPTVFMIFTPSRMLINPYLYKTEAYRTLSLEFAGPTSGLDTGDVYSQYRTNHFERPWTEGLSVDQVLEKMKKKKKKT